MRVMDAEETCRLLGGCSASRRKASGTRTGRRRHRGWRRTGCELTHSRWSPSSV